MVLLMTKTKLAHVFAALILTCLLLASIGKVMAQTKVTQVKATTDEQTLPAIDTEVRDSGPDTASTSPAPQVVAEPESAAVVVNNKRLFVYSTNHDGMSPALRAERSAEIIRILSQRKDFDPASLTLVETAQGTDIMAGKFKIRVGTITLDDARLQKSSTHDLAHDAMLKIRLLLDNNIEKANASTIAFGIGVSAAATIFLLLLMVLTSKFTNAVVAAIRAWSGTRIKGIKIQEAELLSANVLAQSLLFATKLFQIVTALVLFFGYVLIVLVSFPITKPFAESLVYGSFAPIWAMAEAFVNYFPKLLTVVFISLISYAIMAFAKFFFHAIEEGTIRFADFDPEWGMPTYKLVRLLIIAFALVAALPYLPGYESESFKQVGLVVGVLLSVGSTSVVGNMAAGTVLTYTKVFKIGDRIKVGECTGDVIEKTTFVTRVRTSKNEIVSLPNGNILNSNIVNYSRLAREGKLILYTTVTIGYEAPWRKIHTLLIEAAKGTDLTSSSSEPFVLQNALNDSFVSYELNVFTEHANQIPAIYSALHQNIQDKFNEAGVEIMSPHYSYLRDGNRVTIPAEYLQKGYQPPAFRVVDT
jgi:small-conductance mechanosensitive channel